MMKEIELYRLAADPEHTVQSLGFDACLSGFDPEVNSSPELDEKIRFVAREHRDNPFEEPILMHGPLRYLAGKDILDVEPSFWVVISSKFKAVLEELKAVEQRFYPVRIYDGEIRSEDDPRERAQRYTDDYWLLYLPDTLKIFNYRESEYRFNYVDSNGSLNYVRSQSLAPEKIPELEAKNADVTPRKMVLNIKEADLPNYFRLPVRPLAVYVTRQGYDLLTRAKLNNLNCHYAQGTVYTLD